MSKIKVQLVKYDMTKTKNRNRKDMLVDAKTEGAVRAQLERIHKGEQVVAIHNIVWDEEQIKKAIKQDKEEESVTHYGFVKFFDQEKGFGFITPEEDLDDLFFHLSACVDGIPADRSKVVFQVSEGPKGLSAIKVRAVD